MEILHKVRVQKSGKIGMYLLSHFNSEHQDNFVPSSHEGNMAAVDVPPGIPAVTTLAPDKVALEDDPLVFQGAWYASVSFASAALAFSGMSSSVEREHDDHTSSLVSTTDDADGTHFRMVMTSMTMTPKSRTVPSQFLVDLLPDGCIICADQELAMPWSH